MSLPGPLRLLGKKHTELFVKWAPSFAVFGGTASTLLVYVTEWRVIAEYIPFYGSKFEALPPP